jgi:Domain of unknown function (DUF4129)
MKITFRFLIFCFTLLCVFAVGQTQEAVEEETGSDVFIDTTFTESWDEDSQEDYVPDTLKLDTLTIQPRNFSESKLNELRQDEDFNYAEAPTVGESLLGRFWRWLIEFFIWIFSKLTFTGAGNLLLYGLGIAVLVIIVMIVLKVDAFRVLSRSDSGVRKGVFHENIHDMDFEKLIQEALAKRDYRNAVRLVFLQSLKILSDKQHIDWQPGKTNHDYLDEVQAIDVKKGLGQLSYYFDYAWYGGFPISETQFSRVRTIFDSWRGNIS